MTDSLASTPPLGVELVAALDGAEDRAAQDDCRESTVGHIVHEIVAAAFDDPNSPLTDLLWVIKPEYLATVPGTTILEARRQKEQVLGAAKAYATRVGAPTVTQSHYVVAAAMCVGDQLPGLDGHRMAVARIAGLRVGPAWVSRSHIWMAQNRAVAMDVTTGFFQSSALRRVIASAYTAARSFAVRYRSQLEAAALLPGVLVRECLWVMLAWFHRCSRRAFSFLGIETSSGMSKVVPLPTRVRIECLIATICFCLGLVALTAWLAPTRLLGVTPGVAIDVQSEEGLIASSALSSVGVLGLGPWVPWALLAVSLPTWEQANRMRWSIQSGVGPLTRAMLWVLHCLGAVTWPVEVVVSRLGLLGVVARALPVILISTIAVDRLI